MKWLVVVHRVSCGDWLAAIEALLCKELEVAIGTDWVSVVVFHLPVAIAPYDFLTAFASEALCVVEFLGKL